LPDVIRPVQLRSALGITSMKLNVKRGLGVVVALLCSTLLFDLAKFDYNLFREPFVFWKAAVKLGTPMLFVMLWFWILHIAPAGQKKP
jgi:hypothetical protein